MRYRLEQKKVQKRLILSMRDQYHPEKWEIKGQELLKKIKTKETPAVAQEFLKKVSSRKLPNIVSARES